MNLTAAVLEALWKLVSAGAALGLVIWLIRRNPPRVTGQPTPEEARVIVEAQKERAAIDAAVEASDRSRPTLTDNELERRVNR